MTAANITDERIAELLKLADDNADDQRFGGLYEACYDDGPKIAWAELAELCRAAQAHARLLRALDAAPTGVVVVAPYDNVDGCVSYVGDGTDAGDRVRLLCCDDDRGEGEN